MIVLIDTSIWIDYFSGKSESFEKVDYLLENNYAATNGIVLAELLPSILKKKQTSLAFMLNGLKRVDVELEWDHLIQYQVKNYERGINNVGIPDLIILDNILKKNIPLLVKDRHFDLMQKVYKFDQF